jgi:hypothetical protein
MAILENPENALKSLLRLLLIHDDQPVLAEQHRWLDRQSNQRPRTLRSD